MQETGYLIYGIVDSFIHQFGAIGLIIILVLLGISFGAWALIVRKASADLVAEMREARSLVKESMLQLRREMEELKLVISTTQITAERRISRIEGQLRIESDNAN